MPAPSGATPILSIPYLLESDVPDVATASEDLALAVETLIEAAWQSYTPTWGVAAGTAPSLGNGSIIGEYSVIGKTMHFKLQLLIGSTTTFGTGSYTFSVPENVEAVQIVNCMIQTGSSTYETATGFFNFEPTVLTVNTASGLLGSSSGLASGNTVTVQGTVQLT
jgi:hypothetical protein